MKKNIISILSIGLIVFAFSQNIQAQNKKDNKGLRQGLWIKTDKQGRKISEGNFKDDYPIDTFRYYNKKGELETINVFSNKGKKCSSCFLYKDNRVKAEGCYTDKKKDGLWCYYNEKGKKVLEENYKNGDKNGMVKQFDEKGNVLTSTTYKNNKKDGAYFESLQKAGYFTCNYKNDKLEGEYNEYYSNKEPKIKGQFVNNKKEGEWKVFNGPNEVVQKLFYKNDFLSGDAIIINVREGKKEIPQTDMALVYPTGKQTQIILKSGEKLSCFNEFEGLLNLLDLNNFILINKKSQMYGNLTYITGLNKDNTVKIKVKTDFSIIADENGQQALKSLFIK